MAFGRTAVMFAALAVAACATPRTVGDVAQDAQSKVMKVRCGGAFGTGFLHRSGHVITAAHVVEACEAGQILVFSDKGAGWSGESLRLDKRRDLAAIYPIGRLQRPYLVLDEASAWKVGQQVVMPGFSDAFRGQVPLPSLGYVAGAEKTSETQFLLVNSFITPGNSGGPVVDVQTGAVLGVVVHKLVPFSPDLGAALQRVRQTQPDVAKLIDHMLGLQQGGVGYAIAASEVRAFLSESGIEP
jgi:S1-C subfamily serine protease